MGRSYTPTPLHTKLEKIFSFVRKLRRDRVTFGCKAIFIKERLPNTVYDEMREYFVIQYMRKPLVIMTLKLTPIKIFFSFLTVYPPPFMQYISFSVSSGKILRPLQLFPS